MSHSFENFMGNKGFHPASWTNQKKVSGVLKVERARKGFESSMRALTNLSSTDVGGRAAAKTGREETRVTSSSVHQGT